MNLEGYFVFSDGVFCWELNRLLWPFIKDIGDRTGF